MKTNNNDFDIDFSKIITEPITKIENKSYKKLFFMAIGFSFFTVAGFNTTDLVKNHFSDIKAIKIKKNELLLQEIKNFPNEDFDAMIQHIIKNSNIYDEKVRFVQEIIAKSKIENYDTSMSTTQSSTLGEKLTAYKESLLNDSFKLNIIRKNALIGYQNSSSDYELFLKYKTIYKTKSIIHSPDLEDKMNSLIYSKSSGNNKYNNKYHVYDTIKLLDRNINNTFNVIEAPKQKM